MVTTPTINTDTIVMASAAAGIPSVNLVAAITTV
jgi:hypothetical protein